MRTEFTASQLENPDLEEANGILRKCVHCGFCNTTCPTFQLTGDELDGPRGRIYLLKNLLEHDEAPSEQVVKHIDRCLSCLSCLSACPSGVNYMHLVDAGRGYIEKKYQRPLPARLVRRVLVSSLPYPGRLRLLLQLARPLRPLRKWLPERLGQALTLAGPVTQPAARVPEPAPGRAAVGLVAGCVQQVLGNGINAASVRLLQRLGYRAHLLTEPVCCGAIEHHLGRTDLAERRLRRNIASWTRQADELGLEALLVNASGCGSMLKDYGHVFRNAPDLAAAAGKLSAATLDIAEFLFSRDTLQGHDEAAGEVGTIRVAYQSPCSMQHAGKIDRQPVQLLQQAGFTVSELPEKYMCCGSAGTYNLLQPAMATRLGKRKAEHVERAKPDVVASGNLGCMIQLRRFTDIPVVHTVELLDWATGGPKPY